MDATIMDNLQANVSSRMRMGNEVQWLRLRNFDSMRQSFKTESVVYRTEFALKHKK
jgi:hypothetical protein